MPETIRDYFLQASAAHDSGILEHFLHGLLGFDHLLASVLITLLSVKKYRHEFWLPSASYLVAMSLGFMLGALGVELPSNWLWAAAITAGIAAMLPFWLPCPFCGAWALVSIAGLTLGLAHSPPGVTPEPAQVVAGMALTFGNTLTLAPILLFLYWQTRPNKPVNHRAELKKQANAPSVVDIELHKAREKKRATG